MTNWMKIIFSSCHSTVISVDLANPMYFMVLEIKRVIGL